MNCSTCIYDCSCDKFKCNFNEEHNADWAYSPAIYKQDYSNWFGKDGTIVKSARLTIGKTQVNWKSKSKRRGAL